MARYNHRTGAVGPVPNEQPTPPRTTEDYDSDLDQAVMAAWATKNLPARLDTITTAKVLGFAENDIQILMAARKLIPLGDPAPAPKWFAAMEVIRLAADHDC